MVAGSYRKLLAIVGIATAVGAPLGALGWQASGLDDKNLSINTSGDQNQTQPLSEPKLGNLGSSTSTLTGPALVSSSKTTITVNGRQIYLSPDGHSYQVIQNAGGTTTLDVSVKNNVFGNAGFSQSLNNVSFYSSSVTTVDGQIVKN